MLVFLEHFVDVLDEWSLYDDMQRSASRKQAIFTVTFNQVVFSSVKLVNK